HSTSRPEGNGSGVPACPVRAPARLRSSSTSACEEGPAGLSTSPTPTGLAARGITSRRLAGRSDELAADELDDLLERQLAREARRLDMPAAAQLPRDRGDVQLVARGPERDPVHRPAGGRWLPDQGDELRALALAEEVDDPLRVGLLGPHLGEVRPQEVRDDEPSPLVDARTLERARQELQLRELHRFVDALEDAVDV